MRSASHIAVQLEDYIEKGYITLYGKQHEMTNIRLNAYKTVLDRTVPVLTSTEIRQTNAMEGMDTSAILHRLAELAKARPEFQEKLQRALGGVPIEGVVVDDGKTGVE